MYLGPYRIGHADGLYVVTYRDGTPALLDDGNPAAFALASDAIAWCLARQNERVPAAALVEAGFTRDEAKE